MADPDTRGERFVAESLDKWTARYVANGLVRYDVDRLKRRIDDWSEWCAAFGRIGAEYEALAEDALETDDAESAGAFLALAGLSHHFGSHVWHEDEAEREAALERAVSLFKRAGPHLDPPLEYATAPYPAGGYEVPYHLRVPEVDADAPVALLLPGLDSNKEEQFARGSAFHDRGLATVAIDGAAQGETWANQAITPDYHALISAVIDDLEARDVDGLDLSRMGVFGMSLGGFYAPHVAANDDRIDACIGVSGPFTVGPVSKYDFAVTKEQFQWACKADSMVETDELTEQLTLRDDIAALSVPTLVVAGERDTIIKPAETERIARRAPNAEFWSFDAGHGCMELVHRLRPRMVDWLRRHLR